MRRFISELNPMIRGFLIIALIALVVVVLQLYQTLAVISGLLRIAFFLAIAFAVYLWWKNHRSDIEMWSQRSRWVFYGAALLMVLDLAVYFSPFRTTSLSGFSAISFILVLVIGAYSMWRVWREEHHYGGR
jgi:drug/metabolite transporter (DMT)-like permease